MFYCTRVSKIIFLSLLSMLGNNAFATCLGLGCNCGVSANAINFGVYNPLAITPNASNSMVTVTCSALVLGLLVAYDIELSTGNSGTFANREMTNGSESLNYNIFSDVNYTQVWGNGAGGSANVSDDYLLNISPTSRNYTTYGRIPAGQTVSAGAYNDTITVTVIF